MINKITQMILKTPYTEILGNYLSTGWITFKKENLTILKSLTYKIGGLRVDEVQMRWNRVIEMPNNCLNKKTNVNK